MANKNNKPKFFQIVDFNNTQHYKHRNPPWVKLYRTFLSNYSFLSLNDTARGHFLLLMLIASKDNFGDHKLPFDTNYLSREIHANEEIDLENMLDVGLITMIVEANELDEGFDQFISIYPYPQLNTSQKEEALGIWRIKELYKQIEIILNDVQIRKIRHSQWVSEGPPPPNMYLGSSGWTDQIVTKPLEGVESGKGHHNG